jgi:hypothetical protein
VSEGEQQQIWRLARSNPTSCAQISKRLVAYNMIAALFVLSPYCRLLYYLCIVAITDALDFILQRQTNNFTL